MLGGFVAVDGGGDVAGTDEIIAVGEEVGGGGTAAIAGVAGGERR